MEILEDKLKSVLILEKELVFSTILKHVVKSLIDNSFIAQAETVSAGMALLAINKFDLLILNISLNDFNCTPEFVYSIKKDFAAMKIIIVSTAILPDLRVYLNSGVDCFVKKTGNIKPDLSTAISSVFK
ncbi:response regulator [Pedobacter sp. Hv1]|uniref:response regulator n=1 Tax=Pedobacter sp. Hv1 TaxID=1740090 RepID=UPI0006D8A218|nr:response regulator [Pedobacter sp. Hv1]KQC02305.1 hypothetical protein AQF98_01635 [Pedobacter sp. Hv1]